MATDSLLDVLEERVAAIEEVLAARGLRRLAATWRLTRKLRRSLEPFEGDSFADRRWEAISIEWGATRNQGTPPGRTGGSLRLAGEHPDHPDAPQTFAPPAQRA